MSSPRCKPGDLVLVVKGVDTGKTATILRQATQEERQEAFESCDTKYQFRDKYLLDRVVWVVDREMTCRVVGRQTGKVYGETKRPIKADDYLLPITPPASMTTKEQSKELSHG